MLIIVRLALVPNFRNNLKNKVVNRVRALDERKKCRQKTNTNKILI